MKKYVIIVAGGVGKRMKSETPKQFILLGGEPLLFHSIKTFNKCYKDIEIIIPLPAEYKSEWEGLCKKYNLTIKHTIAEGGDTRFQSVKNSLELINEAEESVTGIHDAARPLIKEGIIKELYETAEERGNAIPVIPVFDSVREINKHNSKPIDRHNLCIVQTPQCFKSSLLKMAYHQEYKTYFTDDATVVESTGERINLVDGDPDNLKITTAKDMMIAEVLYQNQHK